MKIIYNPKDGAPIRSFVFEKQEISPHYPDGFELEGGKLAKGLVQYNDRIANALLETYGFLEEVSPEKAKEILNKPPEEQYECDFPGCEFKTATKIALAGHKRSHAKDEAKLNEPVIDPTEIPVSETREVQTLENRGISSDIPNGKDQDGVSWYGEGAVVEKRQGIRKPGQGHFVG